MNEQLSESFLKLYNIVKELRQKCPWDREQTIDSIRHLTIEETHELSDAILEKDYTSMRNELGDLIMHTVFYSSLAEDENLFTCQEMIDGVCDKLIRRHPHIYGDTKVENSEQVLQNWEEIKLKEKKEKKVLDGVPKGLPSLIKSYRIQEKVSHVGFDWDNEQDVWNKVQEELGEFRDARDSFGIGSQAAEKEFGDLLFSLVNYARKVGINPEDALEKTNLKFMKRFSYVENKANESGRKLKEMTLAEMDVFWNEAKGLENAGE